MIEPMPFVLGASGEPVAFILSDLVLAFPLVFGFTIEPIPFVLGDFATPCALVFGNPGKPISFVRGQTILAFPLYGGRPIKFITLRLRRLVELLSFPGGDRGEEPLWSSRSRSAAASILSASLHAEHEPHVAVRRHLGQRQPRAFALRANAGQRWLSSGMSSDQRLSTVE
jgi:hypothetical protein